MIPDNNKAKGKVKYNSTNNLDENNGAVHLKEVMKQKGNI